MKRILPLGLMVAAGLGGRYARAADWPNYRGPAHNGISTETGWVAKWGDEGPKVLWKASLGVGYAPISVAKARVYASGNNGTNATLYCFDAATGSVLWKFT